jgi:DNA-binding XRE family transcriptional regulator
MGKKVLDFCAHSVHNLHMKFAQLISKAMKRQQMTDEALGRAVGVGATTVRKWRTGSALPNLRYAADICGVLGIAPQTLHSACAKRRAA